MKRHLTYCLLSLVLGALMWPILFVWPITGFILSSSAYLHGRETYLLQVAAMSMAGALAAQLLRKWIHQMTKVTDFGLTSLMAILICAFFYPIFFGGASEFMGFLETGSFPSTWPMVIPGLMASGGFGLVFGVLSLPIMFPAGMCGVYLLKCVLSGNMRWSRESCVDEWNAQHRRREKTVR